MLEGKKISELDQIDTLSLGSSFPLLDKGATKRIAFSALLNKIENELPESDIDKVKDDVEKLKVKTESINTLTTEMEAVKDQVSGVNEMMQGQNATIRNCVSAVEGLEQVIEQTHFDDVLALEEQVRANTSGIAQNAANIELKQTHFDDVLALEEQVRANTSGIAQNAANIELKQNLLNENQLKAINSGITAELVAKIGQGGGGVPVGTIHHYIGIVAPEGYLMCDKSYNATDYPQLWAVLPDSLKNFDTGTFDIDFRELVIVGAGQNAKQDIKSHDVYELGQFKDDQLQGHTHDTGYSSLAGPYSKMVISSGSGDNSTKLTLGITNQSGYGTVRVGKTTHGKQIGLNYIIKY